MRSIAIVVGTTLPKEQSPRRHADYLHVESMDAINLEEEKARHAAAILRAWQRLAHKFEARTVDVYGAMPGELRHALQLRDKTFLRMEPGDRARLVSLFHFQAHHHGRVFSRWECTDYYLLPWSTLGR